MRQSKQMSERFVTAAILAIAGGFLDAYTYICRGGVFANAQTGNMVLFGVRLAEGEFSKSVMYLIPIAAFVVGIFAAEFVRKKFNGNRFHWRQAVLLAEMIITFAVAWFPNAKGWNTAANVLVSFVCSLQVQSFRKINKKVMATTMCTGNLRSASECFSKYIATRDRAELENGFVYLGIIFFFISGAIAGGRLTDLLAERSMFFVCGLLTLVFLLLFIKEEEEKIAEFEERHEHKTV